MRIGIDGGCLANRRGFGRFARQVLAALGAAESRHRFVVLVDRPSAECVEIPAAFERVVVDVHRAPSQAASARGRRSMGDMLAMGRAAARSALDLIYFPATYTFFPIWNVPRVVVTMHDTLALARPELVFPTWSGRLSWTLKEHAAVRWADRILTVSEASRRDLLAWFGLAAERVRVVPEGPEAVFTPRAADGESDAVLARYGIAPGSRYLLYVGGLSPHKNLPRLVEAFASAAPADVRLILVGDLGDVFHTHVPALRALIARLGLGRRVAFAGYVPDEHLAHLYSRALALCQPSLLEGFGLPPVEAMACGTPVLYSRAGSLPEVIGEAGVAFDPNDVASIAAALAGYVNDPEARARLAPMALKRSRLYTWAESARAIVRCFDELEPAGSLGRTA